MTKLPATGPEDRGADVGSLVRIRRRAAGLTQRELADRAQVSLGTVRDLEQGRTHRPRPGSMTRLAGALGLDAARLQTLTRSAPEPAGPEGGGDRGLLVCSSRSSGRWRHGATARGPD